MSKFMGIGSNPAADAQVKGFEQSGNAYQGMRGPVSQARTDALQGVLGSVAAPGQQIVGSMGGPTMDFSGLTNPVSPAMLAQGGQGLAGDDSWDAGSALGDTLGGAATGAMIGSAIPGVGTAVGAAAGGVIGFASSFF